MNLLKVRNITTDTSIINGFSIIVDDENLIVKTPDRKKGIKIDKDGFTTVLGKWNFHKMHPILQGMAIGLIGLATVGWTLIGMWFLYFLMGNWDGRKNNNYYINRINNIYFNK